MEIEGTDGSRGHLNPNSPTLFGRGNGFSPNDLMVSRRHISFELNPSPNPPDSQTGPRVSFEVVGKNPVWVCTKQEDGKVRVFKRFKRGELGIDDKFCVSAKDPVWFTVKEVGEEVNKERETGEIGGRVNDELSQSLETASGFEGNEDFELDSIDVSNIDPVQEFGFLVIGHEFHQYQKQMIYDMKKWNWFLEDPRGESDDEDVAEKKRKRGGRKKSKKARDDDVDEEWIGESEDEAATTKVRKVQRPKYQTRSKDLGRKEGRSTTETGSKNEEEKEEYEDEEDEEDDTLGGFIVDDDTLEEDADDDDDDDDDKEDEVDEEEEFVEDELED